MPSLLGRIEALLERAVEGGSRALFRHRLQPIELAKAAVRAMERQQMVGPDGIEVPNDFAIAVHPDDLAELAPYRASLESKVRRYLVDVADQRGLVPMAAILVRIVGDPGLRRRSVRVDARMADAQAEADNGDAPLTRPVRPIEPTAHLPRIQRSGPVIDAASRPVFLMLEDGRAVRLNGESVRIGRALDNDLVIADSRVSRYHAQIADGPDGPYIRDLGSTNGTALAGRPVTHDRFGDGDQLSLGGYIINVQSAASETGRRGP